jgi:hypothetical protein
MAIVGLDRLAPGAVALLRALGRAPGCVPVYYTHLTLPTKA